MQPENEQKLPLLPQHAFVLQFHAETDIEARQLSGRIEHIVTGRSAFFESLDTLLAFIAQRLREQQESGASESESA